MEATIKDNQGTKEIHFTSKEKTMKMYVGHDNNLHLNVSGGYQIDGTGACIASFRVPKTDYYAKYFKKLYDDIINCNVYSADTFSINNIKDPNEKIKKIKSCELLDKELKESTAYSNLVIGRTIEWESDSDTRANSVSITDEADEIVFRFKSKAQIPNYGFKVKIGIKNSKYDPFDLCFVHFYCDIAKELKNGKDDFKRR